MMRFACVLSIAPDTFSHGTIPFPKVQPAQQTTGEKFRGMQIGRQTPAAEIQPHVWTLSQACTATKVLCQVAGAAK